MNILEEDPDFNYEEYVKNVYSYARKMYPDHESLKKITTVDAAFMNPDKVIKEKRKSGVSEKCSKCGSFDTVTRSIQTRSSDEGETVIIFCNSCRYLQNS